VLNKNKIKGWQKFFFPLSGSELSGMKDFVHFCRKLFQ
jgi:hypothetical protein